MAVFFRGTLAIIGIDFPIFRHTQIVLLDIYIYIYVYIYIYKCIQCEAPKIAKLAYNSNNYGLWYL